ncbi:Putative pyridoxal phosphate-dependent aminotransferase EpsN [Roseimaritima multifibrata]|uniref:GDP-perosamine synthase n=1 Tax=Roseimaritima multifibrata TaxID=1930274 RepID=A0A517MLQ6_9BACT|nr:LegC family aminotransferase [Roseimaritima multifibrata]QDS95826.1 Putative pyridoxal phosphate-dependent aminotransferase EpsN [Roseimaritima multifibrata]
MSTTCKAISAESIVQTLRACFPAHERLALHEPFFGGSEDAYVSDCVTTGWVSSVGAYVDRFEQDLAAYTGAKHAIAVVNGTAALHISLKLAGVQPDDEVLCPALTFVATANAISYCGAIPHFIDSESNTLGVDAGKLSDYLKDIAVEDGESYRNKRTGRTLKAIVPVHTLGHPVDLDPIIEVCERYRLELVEDAAESLGSTYKGRHTGTFGIANAISFNGNKIITTGGGGAILTDNTPLATRAKHLVTTAKQPHPWKYEHDALGYNYRLPNINAALGCAQLEKLPQLLKWKRSIYSTYQTAFSETPQVRIVGEPDSSQSNYWLNALQIQGDRSFRDAIIESAHLQGIAVRPMWSLLNTMPMYLEAPAMDLDTSERLEQQIISLPSSAILGAP